MSKVTTKFQITIPPEVRMALNIMPGVHVGFRKERDKFYLIKNPKVDPIEKWRGVIQSTKTSDAFVSELRGYEIEGID